MIPRLVIGFLVLFALASCIPEPGGPSPTVTASVTTTIPLRPTTTTIGAQEAVDAFAACLGPRGVDIDPVPLDAHDRPRLDIALDQLDFSDVAVAEAVTECSGTLGAGALDLAADDVVRRAVIGQLLAFSRCVRDAGVEGFPDPLPGFTGVGSPFPVAEIPYSDPGLASATEACRKSVLHDLPGLADES